MKSIPFILIAVAAAVLCVGWIFGGVYTPILSAAAALLATAALIVALRRRKSK